MRMGKHKLICLDLFHDIVDLTKKIASYFSRKKNEFCLRLAKKLYFEVCNYDEPHESPPPMPCPSQDMARQGSENS